MTDAKPDGAPDDWRTCPCIYCEQRRRLEKVEISTPEQILEHTVIEVAKMMTIWEKDWQPLVEGFAEKAGFSRMEALLYLTFMNAQGIRLTLMRMTDSYERAVNWAQDQHKNDNPPDDWRGKA